MSAQTYQVGAHFKALNKGILMAAIKMLEKFFFISSVSEAQLDVQAQVLLDNFYHNFPRKSTPGKVLALVLHLSVLGAGQGTHGLGCFGNTFK